MKNTIFLTVILMLLAVTTSKAQFSQPKADIGTAVIKSKIPLEYDSRVQTTDTVYIAISNFNFDVSTQTANMKVIDYIKVGTMYKQINEKTKRVTKVELDGLFTQLGTNILYTNSFSDKLSKLLQDGLLLDTINNLLPNGKTVYGGIGGVNGDWQKVNP